MGKKAKAKKSMAKAVEKVVAHQFAGATASAKVGKAKPKMKKNAKKKATRMVAMSTAAPAVTLRAAPESLGAEIGQSYFKMKQMGGGQGIRVRGRDFFSVLSVNASTPQGTTMLNVPINPESLPGTRLADLCELYEKYRFRRFKIHAVPSNPTNIAGSYGMSYDRDPSDPTPPVSVEGIRIFMAMPGSVISTEWVPRTLDCPLMEPTTDYFVNSTGTGDERLVDQGQFYFWLPTDSPAGNTLKFVLIIEYDLELFVPQKSLQPLGVSYVRQSPGPGSTSTAAQAGWNTIQTGSSTVGQGDTTACPLALDASLNAYVSLAQGVYRLYQDYIGQSPGASASTYSWNAPTIVPNDPHWASSAQVINEQNFGTATTASGVPFAAKRVDTLAIPPGGAKVYGNWGGTNGLSSIISSFGSLDFTPLGEIFAPEVINLGRPGKFGLEKLQKVKALAEKRERLTSRWKDGWREIERPRSSLELQPGLTAFSVMPRV